MLKIRQPDTQEGVLCTALSIWYALNMKPNFTGPEVTLFQMVILAEIIAQRLVSGTSSNTIADMNRAHDIRISQPRPWSARVETLSTDATATYSAALQRARHRDPARLDPCHGPNTSPRSYELHIPVANILHAYSETTARTSASMSKVCQDGD